MGTTARSTSKDPLVVFFFIAFIIGIPLLVLAGSNLSPVLQAILLILTSYVPTLAAIIATPSREDRQRLTYRSFKLWGRWTWLAAGLLLPVGSWLLVYLIALLFQWPFDPLIANALTLPVILFANFGEEIGWRGFALPRLLTRYTPLAASLILGVVWTVFHAPLYWQRPLEGLFFLAPILPISVIITWLFIGSKQSVLLATFFHALFNIGAQVLLTGDSTRLLLGAETVILAGLAIFLIVRLGENYWRKRVELQW